MRMKWGLKMTKARIAVLEDYFNCLSYRIETIKYERKDDIVSMMLNWQISVKILGYEFIEKGMGERRGIKYLEYKLVKINKQEN